MMAAAHDPGLNREETEWALDEGSFRFVINPAQRIIKTTSSGVVFSFEGAYSSLGP